MPEAAQAEGLSRLGNRVKGKAAEAPDANALQIIDINRICAIIVLMKRINRGQYCPDAGCEESRTYAEIKTGRMDSFWRLRF
jgi:hypothetical protein